MGIQKDKIVSFNYRLREPDQDFIEDSRDSEPVFYLHGHQKMMPGLEKAMEGKDSGQSLSVTLPPEQAYGLRQDVETQRVPIKYVLNKGKLIKGMSVQINTKDGPRDATVVKVGRYNVDIDPNHPLAGKTLEFELEILAVRDATTEELAHGHVHGEGGHQH